MNKIQKIQIESEGETNGYFTIIFQGKDKRIEKGWSCDQGKIEWDNKSFDPGVEVENLLFELWSYMDIDSDFDGRHFQDFTLLPNGKYYPSPLKREIV